MVQIGNPALMRDLISILTMPFLQHRSKKLQATVDQNQFLNASVTWTQYQSAFVYVPVCHGSDLAILLELLGVI